MGGSVFCRHEWFDAAWQWARQTAELFVLCYVIGEELTAVFPLICGYRRAGGVRVRELRFLTVPDTQICDIIVPEQYRADAYHAFSAYLADQRAHWDVLRLQYLVDSPSTALLRDSFRRHRLTTRSCLAPGNPFIALDAPWQEYYETRSRRFKKAVNLAANRLKKAGSIRIDWLQPGESSAERCQRFVEDAIAISGRSWKSGTGNSLDSPGPQAFIRRLSNLARDRGWLSIWMLRVDDHPLAMEYQLVANGNVHALRSDFDAAFDDISPGTHLNRCLLEQLFDRGLHRYYMGPGGNAYKLRWAQRVEPVEELVVYGGNVIGRALATWEIALRPMARRVRDRLHRKRYDESHDDDE